ncbi:MAG TPA: hypothetical protein V6C85_03100 [Allocoleopsis sp.]
MYSLEGVIKALDSAPLVEALHELEGFAKSQSHEELARWASAEINGYSERDVEALGGLPSYRKRFRIPVTEGIHDIEDDINQLSPMQLVSSTSRKFKTTFVRDRSSSLVLDAISREETRIHLTALIQRIRSEIKYRLKQAFPEDLAQLSYPVPDLKILVKDSELAHILVHRWEEANLNFQSGAYLSTIFMLGSILEGALLAKVEQNLKQANQSSHSPKDKKTGKVLPLHQWKFVELIKVAHDCGWLGKDVHDFSNALRD